VQESRCSAGGGQRGEAWKGTSGTGVPDSQNVGEEEWHADEARGRSARTLGGAIQKTQQFSWPLCVSQVKGSVNERRQCSDLATPCR